MYMHISYYYILYNITMYMYIYIIYYYVYIIYACVTIYMHIYHILLCIYYIYIRVYILPFGFLFVFKAGIHSLAQASFEFIM